jgi:IPT/TIG domain-containing protein/cysteine-rich secretory family protein
VPEVPDTWKHAFARFASAGLRSSAARRLAATIGAGALLWALPYVPPASPVHLPATLTAGGGWLDRFNAWRTTTGVSALTENPSWSQGDYNHALYMVKNDLVTHYETPGVPYYTAAGDTAARNSNIEVSSTTAVTDQQAIDWWMGAPFHAMNMMDPRLQQTGFGAYREAKSGWESGFAVDTIRGNSFSGGTYPVYWPGNGVTEPLTNYSGYEYPDPLQACPGYSLPAGLPVFIEVGGNVSTTAGPTHSFTGNGVSLEHCVIDSNNGSVGSYLTQRGAVIVVPRQPLQSGVRYVIALTVNGVAYTWSFRVGPTLLPQLTVSGVSPIGGPPSGGTTVTITGTGFSNGMTGIKFGTTPAASFTVVNDTTATAVSPAHAAGTVDVTVTTAAGTSATSALDQFIFGACTSATAAAAPPSPSTVGATVTITASAGGCTSPLYAFWLMYPDGTWHMLQAFGSNTWKWNTSTFAAGNYTIHVWANNTGDSQAGYETFGTIDYSVLLSGACASSGLTFTGPATRLAGSPVAFTATSGGCASPRYEYWVGDPYGNWSLGRPFTSDPTWSWDTAGLAPGAYTVHVWANQAGDPMASWEAYGSSTVTLAGCTSAALTPANPSAPVASTVTLSATSTGCSNPQYEFWVMYPDGTWHLAQGFGAATFNWNTAGLETGTYTVHVWANQQGASTAAWESYGSDTVTLTGCSSAALSPANPSAVAGSIVTLTATSSGCSNPQYEFWVMYPDGTWHLAQGFGGATFTWNTFGLAPGTYTVHVWANQQSASTASWETYGSDTVILTGCTSAALSPPSGSAAAGTPVTFTASASGCPNPLYELWLQYPDGTWHVMQPFSASNTWKWTTVGFAKGNYVVHVWANNQGADYSTYETYGSATYTLT